MTGLLHVGARFPNTTGHTHTHRVAAAVQGLSCLGFWELQMRSHPMHFWTSAGLGSALLLPGKAVPTASCSRTRPDDRNASLKGADTSSSCGNCSGRTAGATPCVQKGGWHDRGAVSVSEGRRYVQQLRQLLRQDGWGDTLRAGERSVLSIHYAYGPCRIRFTSRVCDKGSMGDGAPQLCHEAYW